jgi:hypothetical protein
MKHHAQFILFDMAMRRAWFGRATLTNGLNAHAMRTSSKEFQLKG